MPLLRRASDEPGAAGQEPRPWDRWLRGPPRRAERPPPGAPDVLEPGDRREAADFERSRPTGAFEDDLQRGDLGPSYPVSPARGVTAPKAGFWIRFVAWAIDDVLLLAVGAIFGRGIDGTAGAVFGALIAAAYYIAFWATTGQTLGHKLLGLRVVRTDGGPVGVGAAIARYLGYILSFAVLCIGFIWIAFDKDQQGWHDKIAGTYVIKV